MADDIARVVAARTKALNASSERMCEHARMHRRMAHAIFFGLALSATACSSSSDGGAGPSDGATDTPVDVPDAQCIGHSFGLSRIVPGMSAGVQSVFDITSHSVDQAATSTGPSSLVVQITGGNLELDWHGDIDDGQDVSVTGGTLVVPEQSPAPAGSFCVLPGTVWHKKNTGGTIEFVVAEGSDCATSDAGTDDAGSPPTDAGPTQIMKGCLVY